MNAADSINSNRKRTENKSVEQLQSVVQRYCLSLTKSVWDAEDLAQDTWLKGINIIKGTEHNNPEALLIRIAKNTWIDQSRRKNIWTRIVRQEKPKEFTSNQGILVIEEALHALIKHLSPLQRTVFLLRDVFGYSIRETADMLGTTAGAIKAALHRARESLEAVKKELEFGSLSLPEEESMEAYLRAFAIAYQMEDISRLVELAQMDIVEAAAAVNMVQNRLLRHSIPLRHTGSTNIRRQYNTLMAA
jgi:RNA polymerase sigma-70 factor (ECF subfamily)